MTEIATKTCSKCKADKPVADFHKDKSAKSGFYSICKPCVCGLSMARYQANPEKYMARSLAYQKANPEKELMRNRMWKQSNPEKVSQYGSTYRKANPEKIAAYQVAWRKNNLEKIAAYRRKYQKSFPEKIARKDKRIYEEGKKSISDAHIKRMLCNGESISRAQIPQSLVELKRAQIQISNFLKEQAK